MEQQRNLTEVMPQVSWEDQIKNWNNTGKFAAQMQADSDLSIFDLIKKVSTHFVKDYNPNLDLNQNLKNIGERLEAEKASGKDLTKFEEIVLGVYQKVELEINSITARKKKETVKELLPYAAVGLGLYLVFK